MGFKQHNYKHNGEVALDKIAALVGAELKANDKKLRIKNISPLHSAGEGDLSFFDNPKYLADFMASNASVCIINPKHAAKAPANMALIITPEPYRAYAQVAQIFYSDIEPEEKIHPSAVIDKTAKIGDGTSIGANTVIGRFVEIGANCKIAANATITSTTMGDNSIIHSGVRIGQDGFGFAMGAGGHVKVPQLGGVVIGNDVEIGANTCIDRGSGPNTIIGDGTKIDNLVQIGHNVVIGKFCVIIAQVGIAGSTKIGDYAVIGGQAGISGHLKIETGAKIAAGSGVMRDMPAGQTVGGFPAINIRDWHKATLAIEKLIRGKND